MTVKRFHSYRIVQIILDRIKDSNIIKNISMTYWHCLK